MVKSNQKIDKTSAAHLKEKQRQAKQEKKAKSIVIPNFLAETNTTNNNEEEQRPRIKKEKKIIAKSNENEEQTETLSRKEKRKQILSERLERKLTALEKLHEQNNLLLAQQQQEKEKDEDEEDDDENSSDEQGQQQQQDAAQQSESGSDDEDDDKSNDDDGEDAAVEAKAGNGEEDESSATNPPKRQQIKQVAAAAAAPRKAKLGGTYWKDRKEKQKRTVFVGGIPSTAGLGLVRRLLNQYGADGAIADPKQEIEIEFIRPKNFEAAKFRNDQQGGKSVPKNAYCVLPTKEIAVRVANALDGVWVHPEEAIPITDRDANCWRQNHPQSRDKPSKLRVNSADDKGQRDIAIGKRKGGDGNRDSYYKNNKRGSKPGSLPPKKFAKKN